jgi:hypothetical protein
VERRKDEYISQVVEADKDWLRHAAQQKHVAFKLARLDQLRLFSGQSPSHLYQCGVKPAEMQKRQGLDEAFQILPGLRIPNMEENGTFRQLRLGLYFIELSIRKDTEVGAHGLVNRHDSIGR